MTRNSVLLQFATRTVAQIAPQMISSFAISCTSKEIIGTKAPFLFLKVTNIIKTFWNVGEMTSSEGFQNIDSTRTVILE